MHTRRNSYYDYRGYEGLDINIEVSLADYGIAWKKTKKDTYRFVYGVAIADSGRWVHFVSAPMSRKDWQELCDESWFKIADVAKFADMTTDELRNAENWPSNVQSAIAYHGSENVFGLDYGEGFVIGRPV